MKPDQYTLDALVDAESAMFHVLADDGFNTDTDKEAMQLALEKVRTVIERKKFA